MSSVPIKTDEEILKMKAACKVAADVLNYIESYIQPGISTGELDQICHDYMIAQNTIPATLNYAPPGHAPYKKSTCISINNQVCHGVPNETRLLKNGDIVNIDVTVILDGWYGDTSRMFYVNCPTRQAQHLCEVTFECMWKGILAVRPGAHLGDIGFAIQKHAENNRYSVVREFCGHGIGQRFHEPPQVLHLGKQGEGLILEHNMVFTIEPMINIGQAAIKVLSDGWTVVTRDRSLSAQWEHTVRVTNDSGYEVLTLSPREKKNV